MGKDFPLSPLGPSTSRHNSDQSFESISYLHSPQKPFATSPTPTSDEFGRSRTTLAAEQVHQSSILQWWWMEIGASIISIITMVIQITILSRQDGKPIQTWENGYITVNAVIVAVSTLNRISLMFPVSGAISQAMWIWFSAGRKSERCQSRLEDLKIFDEASRGAWGSMFLLWRLRKTIHLASIGAILTIASLAFDIFTQQVIGYQNINVAATNATMYTAGDIPRLETYSDYTHGAIMAEWIPTLPAKAALKNSFFASSISGLSIPCSTSNCTWPVVPSLAVCGECTDVTYTKNCVPISNLSSTQSCTYTMESGTSVTVIDAQFIMNLVFSVVPKTNGTVYNQSDPMTPYISVFDMMYTPYNTSISIPSWTDVKASECALWFCVQAYTTTMNSSLTHETSTNYSTISPIPNVLSNISATRTFTDIPASLNTLPNSTYSVWGESLTALQNFIWSEEMFDGNISAGSAETESTNDYILAMWYQTADLDAWIKRLASGMTNFMRTYNPAVYDSSSASNTTGYKGKAFKYYGGTAYYSQVLVLVRWQWLTFPLGLIALSVLFLILSIIRTRRSSIGAWKSSPLALLFADVEPSIRSKTGMRMNVAGGLEESIGEEKALLKPEFGGKWVFRAPR